MDIGTWIMIFLVLGILIWIVLSVFTICEEEVGIVVSNHNATAIPRARIGFFNLYWNFSGPFVHVKTTARANKVDEIEIKHHTQDGTPITVRISIKFTFTPQAFATVYNVEHSFSEEILKRFIRDQIQDEVRAIVIGRTWGNINEHPEDFQEAIQNEIERILIPENFNNPEITKVAAVFSANIQDQIKDDNEVRGIVRKFDVDNVRVDRQGQNIRSAIGGLDGAPVAGALDDDQVKRALDVLKFFRGDKASGDGGGKKP